MGFISKAIGSVFDPILGTDFKGSKLRAQQEAARKDLEQQQRALEQQKTMQREQTALGSNAALDNTAKVLAGGGAGLSSDLGLAGGGVPRKKKTGIGSTLGLR